jgi:ribonuclease P protein component
MLLKENRLKKKKDFERVFSQGRNLKGDFLFFKTINNKLEDNRIGFIVSKKVSKKAVERNKIKRRLREILRSITLDNQEKIDGVFITFPSIKEKSFEEMKKEVFSLLKKAGLVK